MDYTEQLFSEEQLDFLTEMMNVGIGNAATALEQLLQCNVQVKIPQVKTFPASHISTFFQEPALPVACVRMGMVGDVTGDLFFITPDKERAGLIHLAEEAVPGTEKLKADFGGVREWNASVISEIANIAAGAYLGSIYEFCRLKLYHTVPLLSVDMMQAVLDESIARRAAEDALIILIQNDFVLSRKHFVAFFLLMIPTMGSMEILANAFEKARQQMYGN